MIQRVAVHLTGPASCCARMLTGGLQRGMATLAARINSPTSSTSMATTQPKRSGTQKIQCRLVEYSSFSARPSRPMTMSRRRRGQHQGRRKAAWVGDARCAMLKAPCQLPSLPSPNRANPPRMALLVSSLPLPLSTVFGFPFDHTVPAKCGCGRILATSANTRECSHQSQRGCRRSGRHGGVLQAFLPGRAGTVLWLTR